MSELGAVVTETELRLRLNKFSRLSLADLPTPLLDCPRLSEEVGGPSILVKREDQTGMAFGGNRLGNSNTRWHLQLMGVTISCCTAQLLNPINPA